MVYDEPGSGVPMDDAMLMRILHGGAGIAQQRHARMQRKAVISSVFRDRPALDEFHHQVGTIVRGHAGVEQTHDVRMREARQNLAFGAEAPQHIRAMHRRVHDLGSHLLGEIAVDPLGQIHHAHAAASDWPRQPKRADPDTGQILRKARIIASGWFRVEERTRGIV